MLSNKLSIIDIKDQIVGKRVLMRIDFNVPIKDGIVQDVNRIKQTIPTIEYALKYGARGVILISHLGRPNGEKNKKYSLKPVAEVLQQFLSAKVDFLEDCIGEEVQNYCSNISNGQVVLLENLRFYLEEEVKIKTDTTTLVAKPEDVENFRNQLSQLGDIYINDAFANAHRAHSSMVGISIPIRAAGLLMIKEIKGFSYILENPKRPFSLIMGGAKISDKIKLISNMLPKIDQLLVGGGLALTILKHHNNKIGNSIFDKDAANTIKEIYTKLEQTGVKLILPVDFICSNAKLGQTGDIKVFKTETGIDDGWSAYDIGPETCKLFSDILINSKTVCWNGPVGVIEYPEYANGCIEILKSLIKTVDRGGYVVLGGGETVMVTNYVEDSYDKISHISTGGGASLELLEGIELPGIKFISDK
jgi:phosphoglycerate kinase